MYSEVILLICFFYGKDAFFLVTKARCPLWVR